MSADQNRKGYLSEIKELESEIEQKVAERGDYLVPEASARRNYSLAYYPTALVCVSSGWVVVADLISPNRILTSQELISEILSFVGYFFGAFYFRSAKWKAPENHEYREEWLFHSGRLRLFSLIVFVALTGFSLLLKHGSDRYRFLLVLSTALYLTYLTISFYISKYPIYLIKGNLSGIGSLAVLLAFILLVPRFLASETMREYPDFGMLFIIPIVIISLLALIALLFYKVPRKSKLNLVQATVIQIVKPDRILEAFASVSVAIEDKIKALNIIKKLEKTKAFGVKIALTEELIKQYSKPYGFSNATKFVLLSVVIPLFYKTIDAIYEDLVQESLSTHFIKPFLCKTFGWFCK